MNRSRGIPEPAVRRLSLYLRQLEMFAAQHERTVSSKKLGDALGLSDSQVRKDLAYFGQFGNPGIGYPVENLIVRIRKILGTDKSWNVLLVGMGNLGKALMSYRGFAKKGFHIVAVFDKHDRIVGRKIAGPPRVVVQPMHEMEATVKKMSIRLAVLAVPAAAAQEVADRVLASGVRGILNFAPVTLQNPGCVVSAVDLAVHLEQLSFRLAGGSP